MMCKGLVTALVVLTLAVMIVQGKKNRTYQNCPPETKDDIEWPETEAGKTAFMSCPNGKRGNATRYCKKLPIQSQGKAWGMKVNLDDCEPTKNQSQIGMANGNVFNESQIGMANGNVFNESVIDISQSILDNLVLNKPNLNHSSMSSKNLKSTILRFKEMADYLKQSNGSLKFFKREENIHKVVSLVDKLLDLRNEPSWRSLNREKGGSKSSISNLVKAVDSIGVLVAKMLNTTNKTIVIESKNLVFKVSMMEPGSKNFANFTWQQSSISLPPELFSDSEPSIEVTVVYLTLNKLLKLPVLMAHNAKRDSHGSIDVTSTIISSTVTPRQNLTKSFVKIVLANKQRPLKPVTPVCISWNPGTHNHAWTDRGCHVMLEETDVNKTTCACNHLTLFSSFMDPHQIQLSDFHQLALDSISFIGCSISLLSVTVTFITIVSHWSRLRSLRLEVLLNMCVAIGSVCFLVLVEQPARANKIACKLMAILLHYFLLTAFAWMFNEGFLLYLLVIKVDMSTLAQNVRKPLYCIGWGFPMLLLAISLWATESRGYGTAPLICWLSVEHGVVWAFVAPALVVVVINLYVLFKIITRVKRGQRLRNSGQPHYIITSVRATIVTMPLLGVTWIFGVLMFHIELTAIKYVFAVLNSLQGGFIFIFHCLLDRQVRKAIRLSRLKRKSKRTSPIPTIQVKPCVIYRGRHEAGGNRLTERRKACIDHAVIHL